MKTVVVFDTEDEKGMQATFKIVDHLAKEYLDKNIAKHILICNVGSMIILQSSWVVS